jgi:hypothetical protein
MKTACKSVSASMVNWKSIASSHRFAHGPVSRFKVLAGWTSPERPLQESFSHKSAKPHLVDASPRYRPNTASVMTLRLLALQTETLTLERLGMFERDLHLFEDAIAKPHGMILLTGPTGSGKTTTLYAALRKLIAQEEWNIVTIEDPIEYGIPGVAQVEVDSGDKVSFGKALRSVLRHDPDIVMIAKFATVKRPTRSRPHHRLCRARCTNLRPASSRV